MTRLDKPVWETSYAAPMTTARVFFVNRFYYPDHSATAQILTDLAVYLVEQGWHVEVVTSRALYDGGDQVLADREDAAGVRIHRVGRRGGGRKSMAARLLGYVSFYPGAMGALLRQVRRGDIIVAKTDPPLLATPLALVARLKGARLVNWWQDVYPEIADREGIRLARGLPGALLRSMRNASIRAGAMNVAIGSRMAEHLAAEAGAAAHICVVDNWTDETQVVPMRPDQTPLRKAWGFAPGDLVVGYSGNLGVAHDVDTVLDAARRLRGEPVSFLFVGGGSRLDRVRSIARAEGLDRIVFQPYQPRERLAESLAVADIHWMSLRPDLEGLIVPSKFYGIAAAGRGVIMIGDPDGEIGRLVRAEDVGHVVSPGDVEGLVAVLRALALDRSHAKAAGERARRLLETRYSRQTLLEKWRNVLAGVASR